MRRCKIINAVEEVNHNFLLSFPYKRRIGEIKEIVKSQLHILTDKRKYEF